MTFFLDNETEEPLRLTIEPLWDQHHVPAGGRAIITIADGDLESMEIYSANSVVVWGLASVEIVAAQPPTP